MSWNQRADALQSALLEAYWNPQDRMMNQWDRTKPDDKERNFYYWWQAHVIDCWVDAYERTREAVWLEQVRELCQGVKSYNGDTFTHNYYDDMEWTALALIRAYDHGMSELLPEIEILWSDIRTAWNDHMGGGMAWKKDQLDYKNTPANAPAAILAARLYARFGRQEDLDWAMRIYDWNKRHLVDPDTGFVWDGVNRLGDGQIDKDWRFTYCQGVFLGAGLELYRCTSEQAYLRDACKTAAAALEAFADPTTGMLPDEGIDDTGLFKGIMIRYVTQLANESGGLQWREVLRINGERLWTTGRREKDGVVGPDWSIAPVGPVQLSVQLSGVMLLEALAKLEQT